jgi:hypothetical protein
MAQILYPCPAHTHIHTQAPASASASLSRTRARSLYILDQALGGVCLGGGLPRPSNRTTPMKSPDLRSAGSISASAVVAARDDDTDDDHATRESLPSIFDSFNEENEELIDLSCCKKHYAHALFISRQETFHLEY